MGDSTLPHVGLRIIFCWCVGDKTTNDMALCGKLFHDWQSPVRHVAGDPMFCENIISNPVSETTVFPDIAVMWVFSRLITTKMLAAAFRNF